MCSIFVSSSSLILQFLDRSPIYRWIKGSIIRRYQLFRSHIFWILYVATFSSGSSSLARYFRWQGRYIFAFFYTYLCIYLHLLGVFFPSKNWFVYGRFLIESISDNEDDERNHSDSQWFSLYNSFYLKRKVILTFSFLTHDYTTWSTIVQICLS